MAFIIRTLKCQFTVYYWKDPQLGYLWYTVEVVKLRLTAVISSELIVVCDIYWSIPCGGAVTHRQHITQHMNQHWFAMDYCLKKSQYGFTMTKSKRRIDINLCSSSIVKLGSWEKHNSNEYQINPLVCFSV